MDKYEKRNIIEIRQPFLGCLFDWVYENGKGSIQSSGLGLHLVKEIFEKGEVDFNIKCDEGIFEIIVMLKDLEN